MSTGTLLAGSVSTLAQPSVVKLISVGAIRGRRTTSRCRRLRADRRRAGAATGASSHDSARRDELRPDRAGAFASGLRHASRYRDFRHAASSGRAALGVVRKSVAPPEEHDEAQPARGTIGSGCRQASPLLPLAWMGAADSAMANSSWVLLLIVSGRRVARSASPSQLPGIAAVETCAALSRLELLEILERNAQRDVVLGDLVLQAPVELVRHERLPQRLSSSVACLTSRMLSRAISGYSSASLAHAALPGAQHASARSYCGPLTSTRSITSEGFAGSLAGTARIRSPAPAPNTGCPLGIGIDAERTDLRLRRRAIDR